MRKPLVFGFLISLMLLCACKFNKNVHENPLFSEWAEQFGMPPFENTESSDYKPVIEVFVKEHSAEIKQITADKEEPSFDNVILPLDSSGRRLRQTAALFSLACDVASDDRLEEDKKDIVRILAAHEDEILHNQKLFLKVHAVYEGRFGAGLDAAQVRLVEKTYERFVRGGALLDERDQKTLRRINAGLAENEALYSRNLLYARNETMVLADSNQILDLAFHVRNSAAILASESGMRGRFAFRIYEPIVNHVLTYSKNQKLREKIFNAYSNLGMNDSLYDNKPVVSDIVRLRAEKAGLLGYGSYTGYKVKESGAGAVSGVYSLLGGIWKPALEKAERELIEMVPRIPSKDTAKMKPWDWDYYQRQVLKSGRSVDAELLEVYFSLDNVRLGVFELCNRLFHVTFRPVQVDLYSKDCQAFEVFDADNSHLGIMIFDYFPREGKKNGAWTQAIRMRSQYGGAITCSAFNFLDYPGDNRPVLLTFPEVEILFREVGNALEMMFINTPYVGLQCPEYDFAGLTGELFTYWALDPQMLETYAMHYSSSKQLAEINIKRIVESRNYNRGYKISRETASAYLDADVHSEGNLPADSIKERMYELLNGKRGLPDKIYPVYGLTNFRQVFGRPHGAEYYGVLRAAALGADVFDMFANSPIVFDPRIARMLREEVLAKAGSAPAEELYRNFRGREVSVKPFLYYNGFTGVSALEGLDVPEAPEVPEVSEPGTQEQPEGEVLPDSTAVEAIPAPVPSLELWNSGNQ